MHSVNRSPSFPSKFEEFAQPPSGKPIDLHSNIHLYMSNFYHDQYHFMIEYFSHELFAQSQRYQKRLFIKFLVILGNLKCKKICLIYKRERVKEIIMSG